MILNAVEWLSVTCIYIVSLPFHVDVSKWYTQPVSPPSSCPQLNVVARIARDIVSLWGIFCLNYPCIQTLLLEVNSLPLETINLMSFCFWIYCGVYELLT